MGNPLNVVDDAVAALDRGGVVVIPTDTVYGLAARVDRPKAIERILELKRRPPGKPLQLLIAEAEWLERLAIPSHQAQVLAGRFWPGPLTIIVRSAQALSAAVVSDGTVGLRLPAHPLAIELSRRAGPLAATSANRSGAPTPHDVPSIRSTFGDGVDVYVDGGPIADRASTVVDVTGAQPVIVREGALSRDEIRSALEFGFEAG